ncbi:hypothetical protein [Limnoglobus roseus]|uniref:Uncharacterized protein n=1 Tax=Limnoglobus roseus TaxID=2598579 RepID=A0A5C1AF51_9BACT|nr:hypothetical protein [Limnoglobus roseus]QEL16853.1 hypothetical protein PX52LOC_03827 [Limnoglobus roseus]
MLTVPRPFLRAFRALGRTCAGGRRHGLAPPLTVSCDRIDAVLTAYHGEVVLTGRWPGAADPFDPVALPGDVFDGAESPGDDPVTIAVVGRRAEVRWADHGGPRVETVAVTPPGPELAVPSDPTVLSPVPIAFVTALSEAGRTTSREANRYALNRVQVRGDTGDVIASDGVTAYWKTGFAFPFAETLLVPAMPLFGSAEWAKAATVAVGRTNHHLVVRAGPWTAFLRIAAGRFPDVSAVVPRTPRPTTVSLDPADAVALATGLPTLPGHRDEKRPVTLDLAPGRPPVVRGRDGASGETAEVVLSRSRVTNGPTRVAVDRAFLLRAVRLGCSTIRVAGADRPVVACGDDLTWLAATLPPDAIVAAHAPVAALVPANPRPHPASEARSPMKLPEPNGPARDRPDPADPGDPLAEAEALRSHLFEATQAAGRLVTMLKAKKKEQKTLATVYSSLKALNLGP